MKIITLIASCAAAVALASCASSHVLVGTARAPIDPDQVKVYLQAPPGAETIALLEASDIGANGFSAQSRTNKVMKRLRKEAAKLGANGIVLQGFSTQYTGSIGTGVASATGTGNTAFGSGVGFTAAQRSKDGKAIAVFVPDH